jgi:prophage antirepressor-like protein
MSDLQNFLFEGQEIRFVGTTDSPEWIAVDVCKILEIANVSDTLSDFEDDEKGIATSDTLGGIQGMLTVTEPGLYRLIFKSRKPVAKRFQKWVFGEVLPSIRKKGFYSGNVQNPTQQFFPVLAERRERLEIIQLGMDLLSQLGGLDERTEIQLKGLVQDIVLADRLHSTALPGTTDRLEWTLSDRIIHLGYKPQDNKMLMRLGKAAATLYRARYGKDENDKYIEPPKKEQFVDGATRMVNLYDSKNADLLDAAIKQILGDLP